METTTATIDREQLPDYTSFGNQERTMAAALSRYLPSFYRQAFRYLGNVADAEDAVQDALLSAHQHIGQFRGDARISTWLTSIVINSARMQLRRRSRQMHVSLDERPDPESYALSELLPDHRPSPAEQCLRSDLADNVLQLAQQLSPALRSAFQLRHLDGLTIREMTDILGVAEGTVKARLARARAKLRSLMRRRIGHRQGHTSGTTAPPESGQGRLWKEPHHIRLKRSPFY
jgi:RNA polymerase sigma-70 factor (ECF subfamily)